MKRILIATALAAVLPTMAYGSEPLVLSSGQEKIVGLYVPLEDLLPEGGDGKLLPMFPIGAFALFGSGPEGGDSRSIDYIPTVLKVDMGFIDPFEGIQTLLAMNPIETGIITPIEQIIITASSRRANIDRGEAGEAVRPYQGPVDYQVVAGNYPKVDLPAGHMSEGGASPS